MLGLIQARESSFGLFVEGVLRTIQFFVYTFRLEQEEGLVLKNLVWTQYKTSLSFR